MWKMGGRRFESWHVFSVFFFFCVCVCVSGRVCSFSAHSRKGSYFSKINGLIFDEANRRY